MTQQNSVACRRGFYITVEGPDGAGKTTALRVLREALEADGRLVVTSREPGGSPGAEKIRALMLTGEADAFRGKTEALMMCAARHEATEATYRPALARGAVLLVDRGIDTTVAYQGYGRGLDPAEIEKLSLFATDGLKPDLTLMIDVPVEIGLGRSLKRNAGEGSAETRFESLELAFHQRLREGFLARAVAEPNRIAVFDGTQEMAALHAALIDYVRSAIQARGLADPERLATARTEEAA